jgi:hypothetical protein
LARFETGSVISITPSEVKTGFDIEISARNASMQSFPGQKHFVRSWFRSPWRKHFHAEFSETPHLNAEFHCFSKANPCSMGFAANMEQEKSEWILIYVLAALAPGTDEFGRCPGSRCSLEKAKGSNGLESFSMNVVKFLSDKCVILHY